MIISGNATYFLEANVDTDTIIPAKFLKRTNLDGFEPFAFFEKVYTKQTICEADPEKQDYVFLKKEYQKDCPINYPHCQGAIFLLTWENFGCGSSREHAVYALRNYQVIIGSATTGKSAFADIFRDNCRQNLIWTPIIQEADHKKLADYLIQNLPVKSISLSLDAENKLLYLTDDKSSFSCQYDLPKHHQEYFSTAKNPFEMAREQIDQALSSTSSWMASHQDVQATFPSTKI